MINVDKKALKGVLDELSNSMLRVKSEKEFQKEAIEDAAEKFNMNKKILRKMAKVYHNNSFTEEVMEMEEFQTLYESVVI
jgi:predicted site-specific integrase-resolvase